MKKAILTVCIMIGAATVGFSQDGMSADAKQLADLNCQMVAISKDKSLSDAEFYAKSKPLNDKYDALVKTFNKKYKTNLSAWNAAQDKAMKDANCQ